VTPRVTKTARRSILKIKREQKNVVAPIITKKSTIVHAESGVTVLINQPKRLNPEIPRMSDHIEIV